MHGKIYPLLGAGLALTALLFVVVQLVPREQASSQEKVYVALEGEGSIAVLDGEHGTLIKKIPLSEKDGVQYMPHNVQVSPDGLTVWVTANAAMKEEHAGFRFVEIAHADTDHEDTESMSDQVIAINPETDTIVRRIPIGMDQHLSHIVQSTGGSTVLVAAQETDTIYVLDAQSMTLTRRIELPHGSGPHGMRLSPDNEVLYVALLAGRALGIVDVDSGSVKTVALDGVAVQTAVTPDGLYVAVSLYDSRNVAIYAPSSGTLEYIAMPDGSQGPLQLYPSNDSRSIYVADQGVLEGRAAGKTLVKIDLSSRSVTDVVEVGLAPHGVALNADGTRAYVTNLKSNSVSIIDTTTMRKITDAVVGTEPNGISVWNGSVTKTAQESLRGAMMTVYKSPTCGCCGNYIAELRRHGVTVVVEEKSDAEMTALKRHMGVDIGLESCHTSVIDEYIVEGHVPMEAIVALRSERPNIAGIALPGMPAGSPGMSGVKSGPFEVKTLNGNTFGSF